MYKKQFYLISGISLLLIFLFIFGKEVNPNKPKVEAAPHSEESHSISFSQILVKSKEGLNDAQKARMVLLENLSKSNDISSQKHAFHQLAKFWRDSAKLFEPYAFYNAQIAKLENSEKTLTFAAQQFIDNLLVTSDPAMQNWLANEAKVLLDKALIINPNNDSAKINMGACYMLGNISTNPMEGILPVRAIATKTPDNLYAQLVLGLGGRKSMQYDKAIERFLIIATKEPQNINAVINLAECYELKLDKPNAIKWYNQAKSLISNEAIKTEINNRIVSLSK